MHAAAVWRRRLVFVTVTMALFAAVPRNSPTGHARPAPAAARAMETTLGFEPNRGQAAPEAAFVAWVPGFYAELGAEGVTLQWRASERAAPARVRVRFAGGVPPQAMTVHDQLPARSHYYVGNDPALWRRDVPQYARVEYANVYPGIGVVFQGQPGALRYDFVVAPGADPHAITLEFEGASGLRVDERGDLLLTTASGEVRQRRPTIYQEDGQRHLVEGRYVLRGPRQVGVRVARYDADKALVIDPTLVYSTYQGDVRRDYGNAIAVDTTGAAFVAGGFNWGDNTDTDVFVAKFDPGGQTLLWRSQLRGQLSEEAAGIALDAIGNVHVIGLTSSGPSSPAGRPEYPRTQQALQPDYGGGPSDAFVSVLDADGTLLYSTFLGGSGDDRGSAIALDASGRAYLAGRTDSTDFPLARPTQPMAGGAHDAWVAKLNASKSALLYSTYLGGSGDDLGSSVAVDAMGQAHVAGTTGSPDFPTLHALQATFRGGQSDAFVSTLSASRGRLLYSTYVGGSGSDEGRGIALDRSGHVYVTGTTASADFPTVRPLEDGLSAPPNPDAFLAKLRPCGDGHVYSTFLGAKGGSALAVDGEGNAYVTGGSVLAAKLDAAGSRLEYAVWAIGGNAVALDREGNAYVTGGTFSNLLPTVSARQPRNAGMLSSRGRDDAFLVKIAAAPAPPPAVEELDPRVAYSGVWVVDEDSGHSGGRAVFSDEAGASVSLIFTGTGVQVLGRREEAAGLAQITTESTPLWGSVDTYASPPQEQALLLSLTGMDAGTHTLSLSVTGTHGGRARGSRVWIDGFNVLGSPDATPAPR